MSLIEDVKAARRPRIDHSAARTIRMAAGVSQRRLAREIGVEHTTLRRWENGDSQPQGAKAQVWYDLVHELEKVLRS